MVYRCDMASVFQTMKPARQQHDRSVAASGRRFRQQDRIEPLYVTSLDRLLQRAALEHLQKEVFTPDCVYSLRPPCHLEVLRITDAMFASPQLAQPVRNVPEGELSFFRIVHSTPADMKTSKSTPGNTARLQQFDMAITQLHCFELTTAIAPTEALLGHQPVARDGCIVQILRGLQRCSYESLTLELKAWSWKPVASLHALLDLHATHSAKDVCSVLDSLVAAQAFASSR